MINIAYIIISFSFLISSDNWNILSKEPVLIKYLDSSYPMCHAELLINDSIENVLDVIEELDKKIRGASTEGGSTNIGQFKVEGATLGLNQGSQYNVFIEDEKLIFFRDVNGVIEIAFDSGSNVYLQTIVEGYEGVILIGDGDDSQIIINQSN